MTAEIAIMNKQAIALAADSAVTFQGQRQKIFTSASKIFNLSKYQPIGVMIYGNSSLIEIPWETIIKVYRDHLGQKTHKTVSEYAEHFFSFLIKNEQLFPDNVQDLHVEFSIYNHFRLIADETNEKIQQISEQGDQIGDSDIRNITSRVIKNHFEKWKDAKFSLSVYKGIKDVLRQKYRKTINEIKKIVFEKLPLTRYSSRHLTEIAIDLLIKFRTDILDPNTVLNESGIVIAGFGTDDVFPSLESFSVEGKVGTYLKYRRNDNECVKISFPNNTAQIMPFAQSDMVLTFMTGIDPNYSVIIDRDIEKVYTDYPQTLVDNIDHLNELDVEKKESIKKHLAEMGQREYMKYKETLSNHRRNEYIKPVMDVVDGLPKDELAAMAESLINLTSFKRRVSMQAETVGGPIDVAVISKGDGFVWIKRKHYFESELNPHFFANYYEESDINETKTTE